MSRDEITRLQHALRTSGRLRGKRAVEAARVAKALLREFGGAEAESVARRLVGRPRTVDASTQLRVVPREVTMNGEILVGGTTWLPCRVLQQGQELQAWIQVLVVGDEGPRMEHALVVLPEGVPVRLRRVGG